MGNKILSDDDLGIVFRHARSHNKWQDRPLSEVMIRAIYDLLRWGPTSANCSPARFVFVQSQAEKERLAASVSPGNKEKVLTAPAVVIIGHDSKFYDKIPQLFPHNPEARAWFADNAALAEITAFRNGTLQGAYLMIAARALGVDCGPMSGFDNAAVDRDFFPDGQIKSNFICALGYGDPTGLFLRSPRLAFDDACRIV